MQTSRNRKPAPGWTSARVLAALVILAAIVFSSGRAAAAAPHHSVIYYVNGNAAGANDGTSWADAFTDIQSALDAAVSGDEIWVAASPTPYTPTRTIDGATDPRMASFVLKSGVAIYGGFAGDENQLKKRQLDPSLTILSGDIGIAGDDTDNSDHVVYADGVTDAVLDGFTVTGGRSRLRGGGMYTHDSVLTVANCDFTDNVANSAGGGMYNLDSTLTISDCDFSGNRAGVVMTGYWSQGGGMYNEGNYPGSYESSVITGCTFRDNGVTNLLRCEQPRCGGGGMYNWFASPIVDRCTFENNWAQGGGAYGGGVFNYGGRPIVSNSVFTDNAARDYGGAMANFGTVDVLNCTLYGNGVAITDDGSRLVTYAGGAIYQDGGPARVIGSLFSQNRARAGAGAVVAFMHLPYQLTITKSLFHENFAGCVTDGGYCELMHIYHSPHNPVGIVDSLFDVDPLLADPESGDFHLLEGSPAIDAGETAEELELMWYMWFPPPATDFDGDKRMVDGDGFAGKAADIGADEYVPTLQELGDLIQGLADAGQIDEDLVTLLLGYVDDVQAALDEGDLDSAKLIMEDMIDWLKALEDNDTTEQILRKAEAVQGTLD